LPMEDVSLLEDLISKADHKFTHESESFRAFIQNGGIASE
jgi:hypothetical protein